MKLSFSHSQNRTLIKQQRNKLCRSTFHEVSPYCYPNWVRGTIIIHSDLWYLVCRHGRFPAVSMFLCTWTDLNLYDVVSFVTLHTYINYALESWAIMKRPLYVRSVACMLKFQNILDNNSLRILETLLVDRTLLCFAGVYTYRFIHILQGYCIGTVVIEATTKDVCN